MLAAWHSLQVLQRPQQQRQQWHEALPQLLLTCTMRVAMCQSLVRAAVCSRQHLSRRARSMTAAQQRQAEFCWRPATLLRLQLPLSDPASVQQR